MVNRVNILFYLDSKRLNNKISVLDSKNSKEKLDQMEAPNAAATTQS
jgi:hypothetical protein